MTEQEMWQAVLQNDPGCDGLFFYAVKTTGIYCRPSCPSKPPKRENILFFATARQARSAGFRPCKRCRSDLVDYQPLYDTAQAVKSRLDSAFARQEPPRKALADVGLTSRRAADVFKAVYGMTPKSYFDSLRLQEAHRLLGSSHRKVIDVAYQVSFDSPAAFSAFFKRATGMTPTQYRREDTSHD